MIMGVLAGHRIAAAGLRLGDAPASVQYGPQQGRVIMAVRRACARELVVVKVPQGDGEALVRECGREDRMWCTFV